VTAIHGNEFQTLCAEEQKARDPNFKLWRGDWKISLMRTIWAQRPRGFVVLQKVGKIWRATRMQSFKGQGSKFKPHTPFNRKPMELFKKFTWRQWGRVRMLVQDNPSCCMLDSLKASYVLERSAIQNGVRLIQAWRSISADATERAMVSSNDERICLKERIW